MNILIDVAAKVAEYTVAPIGRQLGYLVSYNANFNKLTVRVRDLEGAREEIKHRVEGERRNEKTIFTNVQTWLNSVEGVIEEANELQKDPRRAKAGCSRWSFPNLVSRHQLSRKATKKVSAIDEVQQKKPVGEVGYLPRLDEIVQSSLTRDNNDFVSRKPIKEKIVQALKDPEVSMVGLYGLGGVGKTTLVKEVARIAKQDKFDEVVMATVSKTPDIKIIQDEIADKLGLHEFKENSVAGRASRLKERIKKEKNILIILDDIWERLDLEKVGIPFGGEPNGCKLLMASRNSDVLRKMEVKKHFRLEVLNEEETWSLFKDKVGNIDDELKDIAIQVANKCAGLPILIITMARSLINQDVHVWKDALSVLERNENENIDEIIISALEFSFKRLERDQMLKKFFWLCATVGGGQPMISDLFKYGIGLGIFNISNKLEEARNRLYTMIGALKSSCLLLEEDTSTSVKMHDVVRDVAISIASRDEHMFTKMNCELNEWPTMDFFRNCSQIKLRYCQIGKLPEKLDCPNLEFFYLKPKDRSLELHDSIFEGMVNIKVIDLTGMNLPSLPTSLSFLTGLQTLCLDQCILDNIDAIGSLKNLQILSLIHSSMRKLSSEIGKLTHLRMLDLSDSGIEVIPPHIISSLINLEELYMGNTSINWEVENSARQNGNVSLAELRKLSNLTALELQVREAWMLPRDLMFEKLERYKIVIGDVWEWSDIRRVTLKTLKLKLGTNIHLEHGIKALIKTVENLYLDEMEGISNVLYQLNGEGFSRLKHLHIQNNTKIRHIIDSMNRNHAQLFFPKLETLVVQNLNVLEKICLGPLTNNSFAKLKVIKVENCIQLKYVLSSSMVEGLPQLSEIEVCQCDIMEKIVSADSDATVDKIEFLSLHSLTLQCLQTLDNFFSHALTSPEANYPRSEAYISAPFFNAQVAFPNLDTLKLSSLNFNKIWEDNQHSFQKLTKLIVENCGELKYLFSSLMVKSFPNLVRLEICGCPLMEEIIETEEINHNIARSEEVQFSKLETIILKDMKSLRTIWHNQFGRSKTLKVINCEKIVVIFPSSMQKTYLNIETLVVTDCALVEEIFAFTSNETCNAEDTTHLKIVTLEQLPNLKQTWSSDPQGMLSFNNLEVVYLKSCGNLVYLFPLSIANSCSHLKELLVNYCGNMKEIVAQKEGSISTDTVFEFNQLNTLDFYDLPRLNGFYAEKHALSCPSLRNLIVAKCPRLNLLRTLSSSTDEGFLHEKLNVSVQQSPLLVEQVIPNLKSLSIDQYYTDKILQAENTGSLFTNMSDLTLYNYEDSVFPDWFLQNVYNLKCLSIEWSSFKKIFQDERPSNGENSIQLKKLELGGLPELHHICEEGFRIDHVLEFVEILFVVECSSMINLVPSSARFSHLIHLEILNCNGMINLISSPTAISLANLTTMIIKGCESLQEIIAEKGDDIVTNISFPSLESLSLECLPKLERFCSSNCTLSFPSLDEVAVKQCPYMKYFSEGDVSTPKLRKVMTGENCKEWLWERDLSRTIHNMFEDKVAIRNMDTLKLSSCNLNKIWEGNQHCFQKLTSLNVESCGELKYLFSNLMVESFPNLKRLEICDCPLMEEIIASEKINHNIARSGEVQFSKLETIILKDMKSLRTIWHNQFGRSKTLKVINCEKIVVIFPSSMQKTYLNIETLVVTDCALVEEIFAFTSNETCNAEDTTHLKIVTLEQLPNLKQTWSSDPQGMLSFNNLEVVHLESCGNLVYLFPLSIANSCSHLKELLVNFCGNMKEIVAQKEGSISTDTVFEFNQLNTLDFYDLPRLNGFYAEKHALSCPSLRNLIVAKCPRLNLLRTLSSSTDEGFLHEKLNVSVQQSPLLVEQVIPNLKSLGIDQYHTDKILQTQNTGSLFTNTSDLTLYNYEDSVFPDWFLQHAYNLKCLSIEGSSFKKIFQDERPSNGENSIQLKTLELGGLPELHHICEEGFRIDHVLEFVETLFVVECSSMINLVPSSARFSHLIRLGILNCNGMINLISSPTAISLANLTTMIIKGCESLQEIIAEKGEDIVTDISFPSLECLSLECLPKLERFCSSNCTLSFPSLDEVAVKQCPYMKYFSEGDVSTPILRRVMTGENRKEWLWKIDLNGTIKNMFEDKVAFYKREDLTLSEFPELKDIWYGQLNSKMFSNLKSMVVQRCDFLLDTLFSSNTLQVLYGLEVVEVRDCDSLEVVFDVKNMMSKGMLERKTSRLKRLTLTNLPKLKHIWNMDPHEIISFGSLCEVNAIECQSLLNVFSLSQCHDLKHLEKLNIERCGVEEIVAFEEGYVGISFNFPHLSCLTLIHLAKLRVFYEGKHALECPSLKILNVYQCEALQVFAFNVSDLQPSHQVKEIQDMSIPQALFFIEKVSPKLEELALNGKDAMMMFNGQCGKSIFPKVEFLRMQYFNENSIILWNVLFDMFPNLVTLQVRSCYFEMLPIEDIIHGSTRTTNKVRNLWLFELEHLRYICQGESPLQHLAAQNLGNLYIIDCPSLISLVPSSMSFQSLKELYVNNCERLMYLITPSIAKSLRQLRTLKVKNCHKIEDVVKIDEEVEEAINFENLEILKFSSLSCLRSFCYGKPSFIFPSLIRLIVKECPQMSIFSMGTTIAPLLTKVEVENQRKRWKNDLNTTIDMLFLEKQEVPHSKES